MTENIRKVETFEAFNQDGVIHRCSIRRSGGNDLYLVFDPDSGIEIARVKGKGQARHLAKDECRKYL